MKRHQTYRPPLPQNPPKDSAPSFVPWRLRESAAHRVRCGMTVARAEAKGEYGHQEAQWAYVVRCVPPIFSSPVVATHTSFRLTPIRPRPRRTAPLWRNLRQPPRRDWSYTFSAKEKDSETGLSYFGSRYYSSDLSIWLSVDPMSDKYPSLSPYVYCANNPVRVVDPNGEEIVLETIYKKDANGNDTKEIERYNIRITGKILNRSGRNIDMEKAKEKIINQIETSFKGQTEDGIPVTTSADFEVANSYKEVKNNDHLFVLTNDCGSDNGHNFKGYTPKNGGMVALVDAALFKGPIDGTFGREGAIAAAHEMGHMLGLNHVGNSFNLMRTGFFHNRLNSFVSSRQLGNIIRNIQFKSPLIKKVNNR